MIILHLSVKDLHSHGEPAHTSRIPPIDNFSAGSLNMTTYMDVTYKTEILGHH